MSMTATVRSAVRTAFAAVGDLAQPGTLWSVVEGDYDWTTGTYGLSKTEVTLNVVLVSSSRSKDEPTAARSQALTEHDSLDYSLYNRLTVGGFTYQVESYEVHPGLVVLEVVREGS